MQSSRCAWCTSGKGDASAWRLRFVLMRGDGLVLVHDSRALGLCWCVGCPVYACAVAWPPPVVCVWCGSRWCIAGRSVHSC
eukprot:115050-Chlamydomonas_euryale.AAC.1